MSEKNLSRRDLLKGVVNKAKNPAAPLAEQADEKDSPDLLAQADAAYAAGDLEGATPLYRDFIKTDLNNDRARMALGYCLYQQEQYIQAGVEFERALKIRKQDLAASLYYGLTLLKREKTEKALKVLSEISFPDNPETQQILDQLIASIQSDPAGAAAAPELDKLAAALTPSPAADTV